MLRKYVLIAPILLASAYAAAQVPQIQYDLFDSPADHGKKFEQAFRQNDRITGLYVDGRAFTLLDEWTVLNTWFTLSELGGTGRPISTGSVVLARIKDKTLYDVMLINLSLQPSKRTEYKSKLSTACMDATNVLHSEVVRAEDKYQSCARIRRFTQTEDIKNPDRMDLTVMNYAKANGVALPKLGEQYYTMVMAETKNAAHVYVTRYVLQREVTLEDQIAFTKSLRASIRSTFLLD